jgi:hypothetical protein
MDTREASKFEKSDLEELLRACVTAGLLEAQVLDGEMRYRITELGRSLPQHVWMELAAPNVRLQ